MCQDPATEDKILCPRAATSSFALLPRVLTRTATRRLPVPSFQRDPQGNRKCEELPGHARCAGRKTNICAPAPASALPPPCNHPGAFQSSHPPPLALAPASRLRLCLEACGSLRGRLRSIYLSSSALGRTGLWRTWQSRGRFLPPRARERVEGRHGHPSGPFPESREVSLLPLLLDSWRVPRKVTPSSTHVGRPPALL